MNDQRKITTSKVLNAGIKEAKRIGSKIGKHIWKWALAKSEEQSKIKTKRTKRSNPYGIPEEFL